MTLDDFKKQNPAYANVPNDELAKALHQKFYASVPFDEFAKTVGATTKEKSSGSLLKDFAKVAGLESPSRAILSGMTFGFGDEIEAGASAALNKVAGNETTYRDRVNQIRTEQKGFSDANPVTNFGLEFAGGLATAGGLASKILGKGKVAGTLKYPVAGAAAGGVAGAGGSETMEEIPGDAARGAAVGGLLGAGVPAVGWALGKAGSAIADKFRKPDTHAKRKLAEAIGRDDLTTDQVAARLKEMGPDATIADAAGENVVGLARASAAFPGKAKNAAEQVLNARQQGQGKRVIDNIKSALGKENFHEYLDEMDAVQKAGAKPLYEKAYQKNIPVTDDLLNVLKRPTALNALQKAARIAADEGDDVSVIVQGKTVPTKVLDYLKRGVDDVIDSNTDDFGRLRGSEGYAAVKLKNDLLKIVDNLNGDYKAARQAYAGPEALKQAARKGSAFLKDDAEVTARDFSRMSNSEQESFRIGAVKALKEKITNAPDTSDAYKRIFHTSALREKVKSIFPDESSFKEFETFMGTEAKFYQTRSKVLGGSPTPRIEAEKADAVVDPGLLMDVAQGNTGRAIMGLLRNTSGANKRLPESVRSELAELLFTPDSAKNQEIIERLLAPAVRRKLMGEQLKLGGSTALAGESSKVLTERGF